MELLYKRSLILTMMIIICVSHESQVGYSHIFCMFPVCGVYKYIYKINMCNITSWSGDGFGHQFMTTVFCKEMAYDDKSFRFVGSLKTHMEHRDGNKKQLLELLTILSGPERMHVKPGRYHFKSCKKCDSVCDSCFPSKQSRTVRKQMATLLCVTCDKNSHGKSSIGFRTECSTLL